MLSDNLLQSKESEKDPERPQMTEKQEEEVQISEEKEFKADYSLPKVIFRLGIFAFVNGFVQVKFRFKPEGEFL